MQFILINNLIFINIENNKPENDKKICSPTYL